MASSISLSFSAVLTLNMEVCGTGGTGSTGGTLFGLAVQAVHSLDWRCRRVVQH